MFRTAAGLVLLLSSASAQNPKPERISTGRECPTDEVLKIGHGDAAPAVLSKVEPKYTEEALKAKLQGTVSITGVLDATGHACGKWNVHHSMGMGLDESAVAAVSQWVFKPGLENGTPAPVTVTIEVNFRLPNP